MSTTREKREIFLDYINRVKVYLMNEGIYEGWFFALFEMALGHALSIKQNTIDSELDIFKDYFEEAEKIIPTPTLKPMDQRGRKENNND